MTYGYGEPEDGWGDRDRQPRGRRRAEDEDPGQHDRPPSPPPGQYGTARGSQYGSPRPGTQYGGPPQAGQYGEPQYDGTQYGRRPAEPPTQPSYDEPAHDRPGPARQQSGYGQTYGQPTTYGQGTPGPRPADSAPGAYRSSGYDGSEGAAAPRGSGYDPSGYGPSPTGYDNRGYDNRGYDNRGYDDQGHGAPARPGGSYGSSIPQQAVRGRDELHGGPPEPAAGGSRKPVTTVVGIAAIVVLVLVVGIGTWYVLGGHSSADNGPKARDISSQQVDPAPLTVAEVFPGNKISTNASGPAYTIAKTEVSTDCKTAVVGDLQDTVTGQGCTQVVRGALVSADQTYVITAGIFNVGTADNATAIYKAVTTSVSATKGRLTGFDGGGATSVILRSVTQLGWDTQGHFLAYCLVARADGKALDQNDATGKQIITDLVENYLKGTVIHARAIVQPSPSASVKK